jgi:RIO kinase 2
VLRLHCSFFNRDVNCIRKFFRKRFRFEGTSWPTWKDVVREQDDHQVALKRAAGAGTGESEESATAPPIADGQENEAEAESSSTAFARLDLLAEASGFGLAMQRELEDVSVLLAYGVTLHEVEFRDM